MYKQIICVPYRDRETHLNKFLLHIRNQMPDVDIVIAEQQKASSFNRGRLLNICFLENPNYSHYVFHDVDMLPQFNHYDASPFASVVQFANSKIQLKDYLGGVTMFSHEAFNEAGGYHNDYFHRAEDNEMRFNLHRLRIPVLEDHRQYQTLEHKRNKQEFDAALWYKAQQKRSHQNQLANCVYKIITQDIISANVKKILVAI